MWVLPGTGLRRAAAFLSGENLVLGEECFCRRLVPYRGFLVTVFRLIWKTIKPILFPHFRILTTFKKEIPFEKSILRD